MTPNDKREAVARIIAPIAFQLQDELARPGSEGFHNYRDASATASRQTEVALTKADEIIALLSQPAQDEGEVIQADREAAANMARSLVDEQMMRAGTADQSLLVQAFAAHRRAFGKGDAG